MTLAPGTKLGPYEIVAAIGAGGMGEVYRARDARLKRTVAIKVLPAEFAADRERLSRFEREACSASALNHPNIITIHELGQDGSVHFIAMEMVEGKTVREMLGAGALPIRKTIEIAAQIAEGLAKAHDAGIAHRDLKPENLMVTPDGFVKILDFGLAKLAAGGGMTETATMAAWETQPGMVVGTVHYMSPEQAGGGEVDFRSDQFSFGLVLYEMVTGKRAFARKTMAEILVAILREQAEPVGAQNPEAPAPLCWAIERCLAKEPDKRYATTRDLARELVAIRDRFSEKAATRGEPRASNIPVQRTGFVGRESEVAAARELLVRRDVRLVTVTGPGGIGKTRLAVEAASGLTEDFRGGIHFVPLSAMTDAGLVPSAIVQTLGIHEAGGQSPLETLKKSLREASLPALLLLDNFEHLMAAAPVVAELLAAGPNLTILVTSRAALHVYGEREFPVPTLGVPELRATATVEALSKYAAVKLFVQRATAAKPDFELNEQNASQIIEICARLDGLPLAIELAAARVKVLSPSAMRTRLASRLQLLTGGARDLPERQQTLRGAIDWSYDLLTPAEQKLFRRLSVFAGGCTLEGVEAVCDAKEDLNLDLLDGMQSMVDKSLMRPGEATKDEPRFTMLETIREYAREKLRESGEEAGTKRAHAAYCLVMAEEDSKEQFHGEKQEWLERFDVEHDNFRAAMEWLTETANGEWGLRLGTALFRYWELREHLAEGRDRLDKVLKVAKREPTKARERAFFSAGVLASVQGDYKAAIALMGESLEIAHHLNDKQGVAVCLNAMAVNARDQGEMDVAHSLFADCLELWRELGDERAVARSLSNLASVAKLNGDFAGAHALQEESLSIFRRLGDKTGEAWSLNLQGDVAQDQGDLAAARALYEQGLRIFRELDDRWGIAGTLADLGNLAREQEDCHAARSLYCESLKIFQELGHKRGVARLLECFACSAATQQQAELSLRLAGAAAALRKNIGAPLTYVEQAKLEAILDLARRKLTNTSGTTAWLEGWNTPMEKAVSEMLELGEGAASQ